ncbi:hypothetical protein [Alishewanella longhuensis]
MLFLFGLIWSASSLADDAEQQKVLDDLLEQVIFPPTAQQLALLEKALPHPASAVQLRLDALRIVSSNQSYAEKQQLLNTLLQSLKQAQALISYLDILLLKAELVYVQQDLA